MRNVSFSELFDFQKKSSRKSGDGLTFGKYPFFTSSSKLTKFTNTPDYKVDAALIFGTGGSASVHHVTDSFSTSTDCFIVTKKINIQINLKFAYYYLSGNIHLLEEGFKGAGLKHISKTFIQEIQIPLPCISEQQKIVAILDAADSLRQKDQQLVEHYTALSQSLFLEMFGDPFTNPLGWTTKTLDYLIKEGPQNGLYKPNTDYGTGTPIVRIDSFHNDIVRTKQLKRVRVSDEELEKFQIFEGDFVINRVNSPSHLGKCGLMPSIGESMVFESNMMRIRFNKEFVNNSYILFILSSEYMKRQILTASKDAVNQSSINQKDVNNFETPLPPIALQNQFAERIQLIEAQKQQAQRSLEKSEALFNSLLQRAFTGELTAKMAA